MKNILVLTYWSYKEGLIQTYTLPYLRIISKNLKVGRKIYLVTFEKANLQLDQNELKSAIQSLRKDNIEWIRFNYNSPGVKTTIGLLTKLIGLVRTLFLKKISHIHAFCTPAGGLGYLLSVLSRKKLILDSFEPHAESMVENGSWSVGNWKYRILNWLESRQIRRANAVIGTTKGVYHYAQTTYQYTIPKNLFFVKPACVDLNQFQLVDAIKKKETKKRLGIEGKIVAVYAGKLGGIYHDIETFEFLKTAHDYWKGNFAFLMLTNTPREVIDNFAQRVGLNSDVILSKFVLHNEVNDYLSAGDFGITPVKSVPTKRYCTPIKDGEYWALGLPVAITPNISDDSNIIVKNGIGSIISPLNKSGYQKTIKEINQLLNQDKQLLQQKVRKVAIQYRSFKIAENIYKKIYSNER